MGDEIEIPLHANHLRALREITAVPLAVDKYRKDGPLGSVLLYAGPWGLTAVATDSYVLALREFRFEEIGLLPAAPWSFTVPGRDLRDLVKDVQSELKDRPKGAKATLLLGDNGIRPTLRIKPSRFRALEGYDQGSNGTTSRFPKWVYLVEKALDVREKARRASTLGIHPRVFETAASALGAGLGLEIDLPVSELEALLVGPIGEPGETRSFALLMPMRRG